jgi:anaerobic ribonucleoside-triphosphate reductase
MCLKVIKRDCTEAVFDKQKIYNAIMKAMKYGSGIIKKDIAQAIADEIYEECQNKNEVSISDIELMVYDKLITKKQRLTAKAYEGYRSIREFQRENFNTTDEQISELLNGTSDYWNNENSNKNPKLLTTQRDYMAGIVSTDITRRYLLPPEVVQAHDEGLIHFHDADYFGMNAISNCCLINLEDMLQNGTCINKVKIDKPHRLITATTITTQLITAVTSSQFGGATISLSHLAPFVRDSYNLYLKKYKNRGFNEDDCIRYAKEDLKKEVEDAVQTFNYQCNSMTTTNGQSPFLSVAMYLGETDFYKEELAMLIEEFLHQRIVGLKNEVGVYVTQAFPKLLYFLEEDNMYEDSKYWYLTKLAAECTKKRMTPDYISEKKMLEYKVDKNGNGNVYPCMGCVDGQEIISYTHRGVLFTESFERMWNRLIDYFEIKEQTANSSNLYMNVDNVKIYDMKEGFVEVSKVIRNIADAWVDLHLSDGKRLLCTPDHPITTTDNITKRVDELTTEDKLYVKSVHNEHETDSLVCKCDISYDTAQVMDVTHVDRTAYSYDVTTASSHFNVSGIYSHNCRSFLTPYINENGNPQYYGRFNQGVVTINLVDVALSSGGDFDTFWEIFDERMELCHKALKCRHERLEGTVSDVAPVIWQDGAFARLNKGEKIDKLLHNGYSTISLGYAGLYECVKYMTGHSHTDGDIGEKFGLQVMQALNNKCNQWKEDEHIDYSPYGTPMESGVYKFAKCLRNRFGVIEGITDRDYITNSYHIPVFEEIDPFKKLALESKFQKLSGGGAISYIECADLTNNTDAVIEVIKFIYDNIMYAELNTKSDYCQVCGYDGEIKIITDNNDLVWECPKCGNRDKTKMNVARRTCGYIGTNFWNKGRTEEIMNRYVHLDDHALQERG